MKIGLQAIGKVQVPGPVEHFQIKGRNLTYAYNRISLFVKFSQVAVLGEFEPSW